MPTLISAITQAKNTNEYAAYAGTLANLRFLGLDMADAVGSRDRHLTGPILQALIAGGGSFVAANAAARDAHTGLLTNQALFVEDAGSGSPEILVAIADIPGTIGAATAGVDYVRFAIGGGGGNVYAADGVARNALFVAGLAEKQEIFVRNDDGAGSAARYVMLTAYTGAFGGAVDGTHYEKQSFTSSGGGNLYAADTTARDALFVAGLTARQEITVPGHGRYFMLADYTGAFAGAVAGTDYQFVRDDVVRVIAPAPFPDPAAIDAPEFLIYENPAGSDGIPYFRENNTTYTRVETSGGGGGSTTFVNLTDTPAGLGAPLQELRMNAGGTAMEWYSPAAASNQYTHTQAVPALVWNVNHNLGSTAIDSVTAIVGGKPVGGLDVTIVDLNNIQITFSIAQSGTAVVEL